MAPCRMMVDNPMQEDRLVVPASEVRGSGANGLWVDRAGRRRPLKKGPVFYALECGIFEQPSELFDSLVGFSILRGLFC